MKAIFLIYGLLLFTNFCFGQNRIEILVNGETQRLSSEPIRVKSKDDKIEIRIYYQSPNDRNILIDSIKTKGCGIRTIKKNKFVLFPPTQQQQQQQSSTRSVHKKFEINSSLKPIQKDEYISFYSPVYEVTACQGKKFYFELVFDDKKSQLKKFKNYSKTFNFYYVL